MKKYLLLLFIFMLGNSAFSADLMEVYNQALLNDATYQEAVSQRLADQEDVPISRAALLPSANVTVSPTASKTIASGTANLSGTNGSQGYGVILNINQVIFDFGKWANLQGAHATANQADAKFNAAMQDLILRVARAYFNILEDLENLRSIKSTKDAFEKQLELVNEQYKVGIKTITDVYTAKASFENSTADYITAIDRLQNDRENLRVITGVLYPDLSILSAHFPLISPRPTDLDAWVKTAEIQNWSIKAARFAADAARMNIKQQFAGHLPTLNVQAGYDINYSRTTVGSGALLGLGGSNQTHERSVTLNLGIPILQGGGVVANTHQAQYQYQVAMQQFEKTYRESLNLTRQSYLGIIAGIEKIKADRETIISSQSSLEGMQAEYAVGTEILVNVLNQQEKVFLAKKQYAHDRFEFIINLIALKQATGTLSVDDLRAINGWLEINKAPSDITPKAKLYFEKQGMPLRDIAFENNN